MIDLFRSASETRSEGPRNTRGPVGAQMTSRLTRLFTTTIRDERDLRAYVLRVSLLCIALALAIDVTNQLIFFESWQTALRSWFITAVGAGGISLLVSRTIAKAHLDLYRAKKSVDVLSRTDPLTGLLNRRALLLDFEGAAAVLALVIVDVDRFKRINDTFGHLIGDEVLCAVATMMQRVLGELGSVGRLGGEEFALLSLTGDIEALAERIEAFRVQLSVTPIVAGAGRISVTISAGLACGTAGQSFEQLYYRADRALYAAKASGRNRVVIFEDLAMQTRTAAPLPVASSAV